MSTSTSNKRGLGKGLGVFFETAATSTDNENKIELYVEQLVANPHQPRKLFDQERLDELVVSIKQYGVIQPLVVRKNNNKYEIVAGERRWRAAKEVGLSKVPVVVREYTDEQIMEIALVENIQRHDLNPIEEAMAFRNLMEKLNLTQEEVAQKVGRSRSAVANVLRMLNLPMEVQKIVSRGTLTMGQARPLLALTDKKLQIEVAEKIIQEDMSAREVEKYIKELSKKKIEKTTEKEGKNQKDVHLSDVQDKLALSLGTAVEIKKSGSKGKILIEFYSDTDLERLLETLLAKEQSTNKQANGRIPFTV